MGLGDRPLEVRPVAPDADHDLAALGVGEHPQRVDLARVDALEVVEMKTRIRERLAGELMIAWLAGAFGILALTLVTVGLYGIIAYLVVSRRSEIGIRLALGSTRARIVGLVLRDNLLLMGAGLAIAAASAIVTLESALCAIDEAGNFSMFCVWKINFKTMR